MEGRRTQKSGGAGKTIDQAATEAVAVDPWLTLTFSMMGHATTNSKALESSVVRALQLLLCKQTPLLVMTTDEAVHEDQCQLYHRILVGGRTNEAKVAAQEDAIDIEEDTLPHLAAAPHVSLAHHDKGPITWTAWTLAYRVYSVGEAIIEQAFEQTLRQSDLFGGISPQTSQEMALVGLQETLQLEIDVSIMEGSFDKILRFHLQEQVTCSPSGKELEYFGRPLLSTEKHSPWTALRISGLAMLCFTIGLVSLLMMLASQRRKHIDNRIDLSETSHLSTEEEMMAHLVLPPGLSHPSVYCKEPDEDPSDDSNGPSFSLVLQTRSMSDQDASSISSKSHPTLLDLDLKSYTSECAKSAGSHDTVSNQSLHSRSSASTLARSQRSGGQGTLASF